jgi:hypothetical protein
MEREKLMSFANEHRTLFRRMIFVNYPFSEKQIESFHYWDCLQLSANEKLPWSIELIKKFENNWSWMDLSSNKALPWSMELIKEFKTKWDWMSLSENEKLPWSIELIEKFENKWEWMFLSKNEELPWSIELIEKFKDQWDIYAIAQNPAVYNLFESYLTDDFIEEIRQNKYNTNTQTTIISHANKWIDEYGAKYSADKKILLHVSDEIKHYTIHPDTERISCNFRSSQSLLETIVLNDTFLSVFDLSYCRVKTIIVPEGHKQYASLEGVVYSKDLTELIIYPKNKENDRFVVPDTVKKISARAFFHYAGLKSIVIPSNVESIETFFHCLHLFEIKVDKTNDYFTDIDGILYSKDLKQLIKYPSSKNGSSYIIPDTVEEIKENAINN